jgi:hypothetical protein
MSAKMGRLIGGLNPSAPAGGAAVMRRFSKDEVLERLRRGKVVRNAVIAESLDLRVLCQKGYKIQLPIRFVGCHLRGLEASRLGFHERIFLKGCTIQSAENAFDSSWFVAGLGVEKCTFESAVSFQCGGHNQQGTEVVLVDNTFKGFVNFFDCWFEGPVEVRGCRFKGGTNLLGNQGKPFQVTFDVPPILEDNLGDLNVDRE